MDRLKKWANKIYLRYLNWLYREIPDDTCCCGCGMYCNPFDDGHISFSMRNYAIRQHIENKSFKNVHFRVYTRSVLIYGARMWDGLKKIFEERERSQEQGLERLLNLARNGRRKFLRRVNGKWTIVDPPKGDTIQIPSFKLPDDEGTKFTAESIEQARKNIEEACMNYDPGKHVEMLERIQTGQSIRMSRPSTREAIRKITQGENNE